MELPQRLESICLFQHQETSIYFIIIIHYLSIKNISECTNGESREIFRIAGQMAANIKHHYTFNNSLEMKDILEMIDELLDKINTQQKVDNFYDRKTIEFSDETTLNQTYADLIKAVYCRHSMQSAAKAGLVSVNLTKRVLEEIALVVWHGDGRTTIVAGIRKKFKAGVTRILTAF